ncbi:MAG TPA: ribokinase [Thermoprotei archaeon]|nr:ribokinase [Thermoprotei archaeon]
MTIIVVIGTLHMDFTVAVDRIPRLGETVLGWGFKMFPGGKGANQAVAASLLGAETYIVSRVGDDYIGKLLLKNALSKGVNVDYVLKDPSSHSGVALIIVDSKGNNIIAVASGVDKNISRKDIDRAENILRQADIVLIQLEIPLETAIYAVEKASQYKCKIILNPAPAKPLPQNIYRKIDILTPNIREAETLSNIEIRDNSDLEKVGKYFLDLGLKELVVTLGSRGAYIYTENIRKIVPTIDVKVVDTTGAGDAFNAGLAVAISEGREIDEAVFFANCVASLKVTKMGAQEGLPTRKEVEEFIKNLDRRYFEWI